MLHILSLLSCLLTFCTTIPTYLFNFGCILYLFLFKPRRMHEDYGSRFVCLSVCVFVTILAATYLVYMSKVRQHTVYCRYALCGLAENISFGKYGVICLPQ